VIGESEDNAGVRFPPPLVYAGLAGLAWLLDRRWPLRPPRDLVPLLDALGALLLAGGLLLVGISLTLFLRAGTNPIPHRPAAVFVASGTYRLSRNPMYLGMTLLVGGFGLLVERPGVVAAALLAALLVDRYVIRREEAYLERRFGPSYLDYKLRVRRWI
jgi:protein-S-isoprenylcysteine O-methyltransferase Ste14